MKPPVRVFETEKEALWAEVEDEIDSQQGSSYENGSILVEQLSDRAGSSAGAGPSEALLATKEVETKELGSVKLRDERQTVDLGEDATLLNHPGEGILINNPCSKIKEADLGKIRYLYKIPKLVEIIAPKDHKRVD